MCYERTYESRGMGSYTISGVLSILLCTWRIACGNLDLLLAGYNDIPTDGSGVIAIPDIGTHAEGALICRHNVSGIPASTAFDNWNYISEDGQEVTVNSTIGWTVSRGQSVGVVRLERIAGVFPLEGLYKCSVERRDLNPVVTETVSVNLYWPITDIEVEIEVVSQESQEYNVTCMAVGGKVDGSSLTGPAGENLGQLQPVTDQEDLRGANNYSISVMRTGGTHGDVFTCRAHNRISNLTAYGVLSGLGAVRSMQVQVTDESIEITWSPPNAPVNTNFHYTVMYVSLTTANDESTSRVTVTSHNSYLRIDAFQGETYEITVIPHSTADTGDSTTVIARVDYVPFQLRIDGIGSCRDWIDDNTGGKLSDIASQIEEVLNDDCGCAPEIQKSEFVCQNEEHDFVIFRGQLFSPANSLAEDTSSDKLLSLLDEWITRGSSITIGNENSINSNCKASQSIDSCIMPGEATTTSVGAVQPQSSVDTPLEILVGLAIGCFIVGVMTTVVGTLTVYIVRKHCKQKSHDNLRNRLRHIDAHQQKNPRYDEALPPTIIPALLSQRDPQSELCSGNLTIINLTARREGACGSDVGEMERFTNDDNGTAPQAPKVANPLYEFVDGPKREPRKQQQAAVYTYIQVDPKK